MSGAFELVLSGIRQLSSAGERKVTEVLVSEFGVNASALQEFLDGSRSSLYVMTAKEGNTLRRASKRIESLGAQVSIVAVGNTSTQSHAAVSNNSAQKKSRQVSSEVSSQDFKAFFADYSANISRILNEIEVGDVQRLADLLLEARAQRRQIFVLGNGGSASTASHMVNDLAKPTGNDQIATFRIIGLADNVAWITASANDYGYHTIFTNQLKNLMQPGDLVIGISSSGNSPNIIDAIDYANARGATTVGIAGFGGGTLAVNATHAIVIPTSKGDYGYHEDVSLILNHIVSLYIRKHDAARLERATC